MNGLEKIIKQIALDAENECAEILNKASAQADIINQDFKNKADEKTAEIRAACVAEIKKTDEAMKVKSETDSQKALLFARQSMVTDVINEAMDKLSNLSDDECIEAFGKLLCKYAHRGKGDILFNEKDINRLTPEFKAALDAHSLTVSSDNSISGGFILKYGSIEENCTFAAILSDKIDDIRDMVYEILFVK